ncbi:MAG: hypothetical protein GF307_12300 [candidate division Zixibacteria bacterium]|nr:hypothetical protein [candidate division Zixibacteria bacterium]
MHTKLLKVFLLPILIGSVFIGCSDDLSFEPGPAKNPPAYPSPDDMSMVSSLNQVLYWGHEMNDLGRNYRYDVYLGAGSANPELIAENIDEKYFDVSELLQFKNVYYWKVEARDNEGETHKGDLWRFSVDEHPGFEALWELRETDNGAVLDYCINGDFAYFARGDQGFSIYDISDLGTGIPLFQENLNIECELISADDEFAYLRLERTSANPSFPRYTIVSMDISNPYDPQLAGDCSEYINSFKPFVGDMRKSGDYLFVVVIGSTSELYIFEIDENGQFNLAGLYIEDTELYGITIYADNAFVYGEGSIKILDITDVSNPFNISSISIPANDIWEVKVKDGLLFTATNKGLYIYDISNINLPEMIHEDPATIYDMDVTGDYLYITSYNYIKTYDIRDTQAIREVGDFYTGPFCYTSFDIVDDYYGFALSPGGFNVAYGFRILRTDY